MKREDNVADLIVIAINTAGRYSKSKLTGGRKRYIELMNQIASQGIRVMWIGPPPTAMVLNDSVQVVEGPRQIPGTTENKVVVVFDEAEFLRARWVARRVHGTLAVFPRGNKLIHNPRGVFLDFAKRQLITWFYRQADALVFQTKAQADEFEDMYKIRTPTFVLANSLQASWITQKELGKEHRQLRRVGFIGDRSVRKGFDIFASAAQQLFETGLEFHCAGVDKSHRDPTSIAYWGYQDDVSEFLDSIDLLIIPSRYDSFPNVLLEAVARDVPVLVSDTPIFRDIVRSTDLLFGRSASDLARRMRTLVSNSEAYQQLVQKSRELRRRYDFDWGAEAVRILRRAIERRH